MSYRCACSPHAKLRTIDCEHHCTTCGHVASLHHTCRYQCLGDVGEPDCSCRRFTGVEQPPLGFQKGEFDARNAKILLQRSRGVSYVAIGRAFDLSPERVRQIERRAKVRSDKRPRVDIVRVKDDDYLNGRRWDVICRGQVKDSYETRAEALAFKRRFDPQGWYCLKCDERRLSNKLTDTQWRCYHCGAWNDRVTEDRQ